MHTYTIIAYVVPAGAHLVETMAGIDPTDAVLRLRERFGLKLREMEIVAVAQGAVEFMTVDAKVVALAPYCPDAS